MAYLKLNGLTIPVSEDSGKIENEIIGTSGRAFDGTHRTTRRATKKNWNFETTLRTQQNQQALANVLLGKGEVFGFDNTINGSKGLAPNAGGVYSLRGYAADGYPVVGENAFGISTQANGYAPGYGSVYVGTTVTNISLLDELTGASWTDVSGTAGVTSSGAYYSGSDSCYVAFAALGNSGYFQLATTSLAALTQYTASIYFRESATTTSSSLRFTLTDVTNAVSVTEDLTSYSDRWTRCDLTITTGAAGSVTLRLYVENRDNAATETSFDGAQLETGAFAHPYTATTRAASQLNYPVPQSLVGAKAWAINMWTNGPPNILATRNLWMIKGSSTLGQVQTYLTTGGTYGTIVVAKHNADQGSWDNTTHALAADYQLDKTWRMYTIVFNGNATLPTGRLNVEIWIDGVMRDSESQNGKKLTTILSSFNLHVGCDGSSTPIEGDIDDFQVLPFAPSSEMIAAWYAAGRPVGAIPSIIATGDFNQGDATEVRCEGLTAKTASAFIGSTFYNNAESLEFSLVEK